LKAPEAKVIPGPKEEIEAPKAAKKEEEAPLEKEAQEGKVPEEKVPKGGGTFRKLTPEEVRNQKISAGEEAASLEGVPVPSSTEGGKGEMGDQKKEDESSFIEANADTAGIPLPTFENPIPAVASAAEVPAYSKLSPEVHELFEKMGGVMLIQQDKGITTTTMNINMPGSVFNGTQVVLSQYSTAPNSFNIQLIGNPESVKLFSQNLDGLKESFRQANFNFETNILKPIIATSRKAPHLIRRKGTAGGKGGKKGRG